jgi:hypothetical protein
VWTAKGELMLHCFGWHRQGGMLSCCVLVGVIAMFTPSCRTKMVVVQVRSWVLCSRVHCGAWHGASPTHPSTLTGCVGSDAVHLQLGQAGPRPSQQCRQTQLPHLQPRSSQHQQRLRRRQVVEEGLTEAGAAL